MLIFRAAAFGVPPSITGTSGAGSYDYGDGVTVSVTATGTAPLSYQWKKNGNNISGATSASYNIGSADTGDSGTYTCVVTNTWGSVTSSGISVSVSDPEPPGVTTSGGGTFTHPANVTLIASVTGTGPFSYQWTYISPIPGATSSVYVFSTLGSGHTYNVSCRVTTPYGEATDVEIIVTP